MKKFAFVLFFLTHFVHAAYVGNPQSPDMPQTISFTNVQADKYWITADLGYEKTKVFDKYLQKSFLGQLQKVETSKIYANYAVLTATLFSVVDLYAKVGEIMPQLEYLDTVAGFGTEMALAPRGVPAWAVGGRVLLFNIANTSLGLNGSYQQSDVRTLTLYPTATPANISLQNFQMYEYHVGIALSHQIKYFIPYMGTRYYRTRIKLKNSLLTSTQAPITFRNQRNWGLYLGCTLVSPKYFLLNFEGRFIDESAFTATAEVRF